MAKNIVICSDGTAATAAKNRGTNVFKLYEAVELHDHRDPPGRTQQIAFYDDGVGTEPWKPLRLLGGAFGWGLSRNVRQLYTELARAYEPEDQIYMFGFSRGAFTVRTLAGFIAMQGLLNGQEFPTDGDLEAGVRFLYWMYRWSYGTKLRNLIDWVFRHSRRTARRYARGWWLVSGRFHSVGPRIRFIGVWDTVDAVGSPVPGIANAVNTCLYRFKFPDYKLSPMVDQARQALSLDDARRTFHPLVWDERGEPGERMQQVWFAGVHCNVGGGYPKQGMSLVTLDWMMAEAAVAGLRFIPAARERYRAERSVCDKLYDSRAGLAFFYRYYPRDVWKVFADSGTSPKIHVSVLERIAQQTEGYSPGCIPRGSAYVATQDGSPRPGLVDAASPNLTKLIADELDEFARDDMQRPDVRGTRPICPLDLVRRYARTRHVSHLCFLGAVLALLIMGCVVAWTVLGIALPTSIKQWLDIAGELWKGVLAFNPIALFAMLLLTVVVPAYLILTFWARRCMKRVLSTFWHRVGPRLRGQIP